MRALIERLLRVRRAIKNREKLKISYCSKNGVASARVICPMGLISWGGVWTVLSWCELRQEYRSFRLDLIEAVFPIGVMFGKDTKYDLAAFIQGLPK